jgi:hypothetical protein
MITSTTLAIILFTSAFISFAAVAVISDVGGVKLVILAISAVLSGLGVWAILSHTMFHTGWLCLYAVIWLLICFGLILLEDRVCAGRGYRTRLFGMIVDPVSTTFQLTMPGVICVLLGLVGYTLYKAWF